MFQRGAGGDLTYLLTHQGLKQFVFSDFRVKFTSYSLKLLEFDSIEIFAIFVWLTEMSFLHLNCYKIINFI